MNEKVVAQLARVMEVLEEADRFRNSLLERADLQFPYPMWHGWAIVEAYVAGYRAAEQKAKDAK